MPVQHMATSPAAEPRLELRMAVHVRAADVSVARAIAAHLPAPYCSPADGADAPLRSDGRGKDAG